MRDDSAPIVPWKREDLLPRAPIGCPYGYLDNDHYTPCSPDELADAIREPREVPITYVWTPDHDHVVSIYDVPFLRDVAVELKQRRINKELRKAAMFTAILGTALVVGPLLGMHIWLSSILFMAFGLIPLIRNLWSKVKLRSYNDMSMMKDAEYTRYGAWLSSQSASEVYLLAIPLVAISLYSGMVLKGGVIDESIYGPFTDAAWRGGLHINYNEPWRLLTASCLHGGWLHLFFNFYALVLLGRLVCLLLNRYMMITAFIVACLSGGLLTVIVSPSPLVSVGASGGIMGLLGLLLVLGYAKRPLLPPGFGKSILESVLWIGLIGVVAYKYIDNTAHLGGLIGGALVGLFACRAKTLPVNVGKVEKGVGLACAAVFLISIALTFSKLLDPNPSQPPPREPVPFKTFFRLG